MAAVELKEKQFQQLIQEGKTFLVDYWAPWCGYCRRIGPAYDRIADTMGPELLLAKINIDEEPALADREQIDIIPTLVMYREGKAIGSVTAPDSKARIEEFIRQSLQG